MEHNKEELEMNEKDRILNLVQKGIITMDEALTLLEASENKKDHHSDSTYKTIVDEKKDGNQQMEKSELDDQIEGFADKLITSGKSFSNKISKYVQEKMKQSDKHAKEVDFSDQYLKDQEQEQQRFFEKNNIPESVKKVMLEDLTEEYDEKNQVLQVLSEQEMIAKQRLRELEIFQEMDDLTDEMRGQQDELKENLKYIDRQIQEVKNQLDKIEEKRLSIRNASSPRSSETLQSKAGEITKSTLDFTDEAIKGSQKLSQDISSQVKGLMKNFKMKDVNLSFEVPWVKTQTMNHVFEFDGTNIHDLDIKVINGSLNIVSHDKDDIQIESELRFHGNFDDFSVKTFENLSTISQEEGRLVFHVTSPRLSIDATVYLPAKTFEEIKVHLTNGDLTLQDITVSTLNVHNKNGDIKLNHLIADTTELSNMKGDLECVDIGFQDILAKNISGDIQIKGNMTNANLETVSGDILITKKNNESSKLQAKAMNGDIKLSQPDSMSLMIDAQSSSGQIYQRLSEKTNKELNNDDSIGTFHRLFKEDVGQLEATIRVMNGDIWLKDQQDKEG